jgi:hypothetical protein
VGKGGISSIGVHKLKDHHTIEMKINIANFFFLIGKKINIAIKMSIYSIVITKEKGLQVKMGKI